MTQQVLCDEKLIQFHVCINCFYNETAHYADIVLPWATYLERWDLDARGSYNLRPYVGLRTPMVEPLGEEDHLGLQLDFMGYLCQRVAATECADEVFTTLREIAGTFYEEHLRWPSALLERVERQAELPFYQALARMTGEFLASESWLRDVRQI